jgi:hypothetical protein
VLCKDGFKKRVRQLCHDPGTIAGDPIGTDRTTVFAIDECFKCPFQDVVRFSSLAVGHESDATGIVFPTRVIKTKGVSGPWLHVDGPFESLE